MKKILERIRKNPIFALKYLQFFKTFYSFYGKSYVNSTKDKPKVQKKSSPKVPPKRPKTKYKFYTNDISRIYGELHSIGGNAPIEKLEIPLSESHLAIIEELARVYGIELKYGFRTHVFRNALVREFLRHCPNHPLSQLLHQKIEEAKQNQACSLVITK